MYLTGDGRLDLLGLSATGQPVRFVNRGTKPYHWQVVRPAGERQSPRRQPHQQLRHRRRGGGAGRHSGTEAADRSLRQSTSAWASTRNLTSSAFCGPTAPSRSNSTSRADQVVMAEQRLTGSCPFLFAWDGSAGAFVTDFLWSTPLGMYINAQDKGEFSANDRMGQDPRRPAGAAGRLLRRARHRPTCGRRTTSITWP